MPNLKFKYADSGMTRGEKRTGDSSRLSRYDWRQWIDLKIFLN